MSKQIIEVSTLGKTWIFDIDGTIVKHNGYKIDGVDTFLDGAKEFLQNIPETDMVIFLTARKKEYAELTEQFLAENNIRYDTIIYEAPYGERILVNDSKPSGLKTAIALCTERDRFFDDKFIESKLV